jgi:mono/diheme cytochrome c family protein
VRPGPLFLVLALLVAGCGENMSEQGKIKPFRGSALFADGRGARAAPEGTIARGDLDRAASLATRPPMTAALMARGEERFGIFCAPCHGALGDGDGMIVERGMARPPSYHEARLRAAEDRHFIDVITNGHGAMYSYAARVPPADRWAIVAYIRALQLSQNARLDDLPPELRGRAETALPP